MNNKYNDAISKVIGDVWGMLEVEGFYDVEKCKVRPYNDKDIDISTAISVFFDENPQIRKFKLIL